MLPTIGWSNFALNRHRKGAGNSYSILSNEDVLADVKEHWSSAYPGQGETTLDRKVVVPLLTGFENYCLPLIELVEGLPVHAEIVKRQEGEKPYIETFAYLDDVEKMGLSFIKAKHVNIVCYSVDALLENNGKRSTDCDWEIVALLASEHSKEPMAPLTMARNFLEEDGGTKSDYTAKEFADAIWHHSIKRGVRVRERQQWFDAPVGPGYYWFQPTYSKPRIVEVYDYGYGLVFCTAGISYPQKVMDGTGKWSKPIPNLEGYHGN